MEPQEKILVFYIAVANLENSDIKEYLRKYIDMFSKEKPEGERHIFVPIGGQDSRIECIYPKFVAEKELVDESNKKLEKLNKLLEQGIEKLENDEK